MQSRWFAVVLGMVFLGAPLVLTKQSHSLVELDDQTAVSTVASEEQLDNQTEVRENRLDDQMAVGTVASEEQLDNQTEARENRLDDQTAVSTVASES